MDDVTLAHRVESQLYRRAGVAKGHISINAEEGVVFLRGTLDRREDIERAAMTARAIDGVRDVENLMHTPGTPAPASQPQAPAPADEAVTSRAATCDHRALTGTPRPGSLGG